MKVEDIVGAVLLRVSGGKVTSDLSVHPADVKAYIPDAINQLMGTRIDSELSGLPEHVTPNGLFVNVLEPIAVQVNSRNLAYVVLPQRPLTVLGARSVVAVGELGGRQFTRIKHDEGTLGSFYYKTRTEMTTYDVEGINVVFYNLPTTVTNVFAKIIVHINDLNFGDEIFVPSGMETAIVDTIYQRVMNQRATPTDQIIDGRDN